jgi:tRNA nucleotidyltransferase (CCA-adding enzyme)
METSPNPGTSSSNHQRSKGDAEAHLRHLIEQRPLQTLITALSPAEIYLVGGSVRDAFLTTADTDLDLATSLTALEIKERCDRHGIRIIETGIQHGTVLAVIDETHIEVTTFRVPSSRDVHTAARDIATDLSGRDFTINALAFDVRTHQFIDPFDGLTDLENKVLKGVGATEERFLEDPLRILRMIRFGDAQGRVIEQETLTAAKKHVGLLEKVSRERIKGELDKILMSPFSHLGVRRIHEIGGLPYTIPELIPSVGFEQNKFHIHDVFDHTLWVLERTPTDLILRWSAIFHDIGKPHTLSVDPDGSRHFYSHETVSEDLSKKRMKELKFSTDDTRAIASIVRHHMRPLDCGAPGVRRIIRDLGPQLTQWRQFKAADSPPTFSDEEFLTVADRFDQLLATELARRSGPSYGKLAVTGDDLKGLGVQPGPQMGKLLKELEELVIEDPTVNTKENLLTEARQRLERNPS